MFYCTQCSMALDDSDDGLGLPPIRLGTLAFCDSSCLSAWADVELPTEHDSVSVGGRVVVTDSPTEGGVRWPATLRDERTAASPPTGEWAPGEVESLGFARWQPGDPDPYTGD